MSNNRINVKALLSLILLISFGLLLIFIVVKVNNNQSPTDSKADVIIPSNKLVISDFYWWYPWYGMYYLSNGSYLPPKNVGGFASQDAFAYQFTNPIPYLQSEERPNGPINDRAAIEWFKGNFSRASKAGINVMTPLAKPNLKQWKYALTLMLTALKELQKANLPYPKLMFQWDGVENWVTQSSGDLTKPGRSFDSIWNGIKDTYDTVFSNLSPIEVNQYLYTYPDGNTIPSITYRIESNAPSFKTDNWFVTQLKANFAAAYQGKQMYIVLDSDWCNGKYGTNNRIVTASCNADNYYHWGGAYQGALLPTYAKIPRIVTVGPGYDKTKYLPSDNRGRSRYNGQWLTGQFDQAVLNLQVNWIIIETFNFGEEGSAIDETTSFGNQYLDLTQQLINSWLSPPTCTTFGYSNWSACINNLQTRTITSEFPNLCINGNPANLRQSCILTSVNSFSSQSSNSSISSQISSSISSQTSSSLSSISSISSQSSSSIDGTSCGPMDGNNKGSINIVDFTKLARIYSLTCSDSYISYLSSKCGPFDSNHNGKIDLVDFTNFASKYGKVC